MEICSNRWQRLEDDEKGGSSWALALLAVGLIAGVTLEAKGADDMRLELAAGVAKHRLAPEGTWWYDGFETNARLKTSGFSAGVLWTPLKRGSYRLGLRAGYSDLGTVRSENTFPIFEDGSNLDARVNPVCNRATLAGCTGKYNGAGKTKGLYFGPAVERDFGQLTIGIEGGIFYYRSEWVAINVRAVDSAGEFWPKGWQEFRWDNARGYHATWYGGVNARWKELFVTFRRYAKVHASQTEKGKEFVGMTSGPLWSVMAGVSVPF